jgi:hypothetical protein
MVEDRPLTDSELDTALADAFDAEPSAEFAARVRRRISDQPIGATRALPFLTRVSASVVVAVVFVVVLLERTPVEQRRVSVAAATSTSPAVESSRSSAVGTGQPSGSRNEAHERLARSRRRPQVTQSPESPLRDVLIPAAEQQALRRLFARPPAAVLRLVPSGDEPVAVSAVAIQALEIDPLSPQADEGEHQ